MEITNIVATEIRVPLERPHTLSPGTYDAGNHVLVEVMTDQGVQGVGEASCPYNHAGAVLHIIDRQLRPVLLGQDPRRVEFLLGQMEAVTRTWYKRGGVFATSGVEMALLDLVGKVYGIPLYQLLGGKVAERARFIGYLFIDEPERNAIAAKEYVRKGFNSLKLKVGRDPETDLKSVKLVRQAVGDSVRLRVDANQGWTVSEAIAMIRSLEPYGLDWVEQPVAAWDLAGMAEVRQRVGVPIAADESCFTVEDALAIIVHRAADVFVVRIEEAGGMLNTKRLVGLAQAAGVTCVMGSWIETGLATAAKLHFLASSQNFPYANDTVLYNMAGDILRDELTFVGGALSVPEGPGLGVEVDPAKLERFLVSR